MTTTIKYLKEMTRLEFLRRIFSFFGKNDEELLKTYDVALTTRQSIDWDKLYKKVLTEAESRYLPPPKWFIGMFPSCVKLDEGCYTFDSGTGVLTLKDEKRKKHTGHNRFYVFDMWHTTHTLKEIIDNFKNQYGKSFMSFRVYPAGYSVINNRIYDNNMQQCGVIE